MVCVGLPKADHISSNFSQILLGPFLNSLSHLLLVKPRKFPYPGILIKKTQPAFILFKVNNGSTRTMCEFFKVNNEDTRTTS